MSGSSGLQYARAIRQRRGGNLRHNSSASRIDILQTIPEGRVATTDPTPSDEQSPLLGIRDGRLQVVQEESWLHKLHRLLLQLLSTGVVITSVVQTVTLPLYANIMNDVHTGSDPFIAFFLASMWLPVIFWGVILVVQVVGLYCDFQLKLLTVPMFDMMVAGLLAAVSQIMVALSSLPQRTPVYLQAIFQQTLMIPFTALARYVILSKCINKKQFACIMLLGLGICMTLVPSWVHQESSGVTFAVTQSFQASGGPWYFYVIFAFSWLPLSFAYAILERSQRAIQCNSFVVTAWFKTFLCCSYVLLFWLDFLPGFGSAQQPEKFGQHITEGFKCFYELSSTQCRHVSVIALLYILSYASNTLLSVLLINYGEGSLYTVIVLALALPLSTLFWTLFSAVPEFHWEPTFTSSAVFVIIGLIVMLPSIMLYNALKAETSSTSGDASSGAFGGGGGGDEGELPARVRHARKTHHTAIKPQRQLSLQENFTKLGLAGSNVVTPGRDTERRPNRTHSAPALYF